MQTYVERGPVGPLAATVTAVWVQHVTPDADPYVQRTIPHGGVDLLCTPGAMPRVIGPRTRPLVEVLAPGTTLIGMRLRPGAAAALLGHPPAELVDTTVGLDALWSGATTIADRVGAAPDPDTALAELQRWFARRAGEAPAPDPLVLEAVRRLMPWGAGSLASLPAELSVSERQLRRRCLAALGMPAKTLHRTLRFQGFLARAQHALAHGQPPTADGLAQLAVDCGYADQAHMNRECTRLTGLAPRAFLTATAHTCGEGHDHAVSFEPLLRGRGRFVQGIRGT